MALTRKLLKGMGLADEQIDTIIEAHTETVNGLKQQAEKYQADAEKLTDVQKELDGLKAKGDDGWKDKHDKVKKDFDDYKAEIARKETAAAKEKAVRAYYEGKKITGDNLELAMRGSRDEIAALELDNGKIKDTSSLDALVSGTFARLVSTTNTQGVKTPTPAVNGGSSYASKDEIMKIKDTTERQAAIAANIHLFRKD